MFYNLALLTQEKSFKLLIGINEMAINEMELLDLWWIIWGIAVAFIVQFLYDVLGEELKENHKNKFWAGVIIMVAFIVAIIVSGLAWHIIKL
jgi:hypothetical protein